MPRKGFRQSKETKKKISQSRKALYKSGYWKGKKSRLEVLRKMSESHKE
jgi:hypothetical protein